MKREEISLTAERSLITHLIVSDEYAREILPLIKPRHFKSTYGYQVYKWISDYYTHYRKAPKNQIQDIYLEHRSKLQEDVAESVGEFLSNLSKNYETVSEVHNLEYLLQSAKNYLDLRSLEVLTEEVHKKTAVGDVEGGKALIANFSQVAPPSSESVSLLSDSGEIFKAFNEDNDEKLFSFPGAVGKVLGSPMRGDLIAALAPPKRGKSFFLGWVNEQLIQSGHNTVFFSLEMRKPQVLRRMFQGLTGRPRKTTTINVPHFLTDDPDDGKKFKWDIAYNSVTRNGIDEVNIRDVQEKLKMSFRGGNTRLICVPMYTTTVAEIEAYLDNLEYYEQYIPDAIIVDYADLLKAEKSAGTETRNQLNAIWMNLRNIAQKRNVLVVTASQSNRGGINAKSVGLDNVAEDMRKLAHVSMLCGLNQTKKEREAGIMRISSMLSRDDAISNDEAVVLQCLDFGRFYLGSRLKKEVNYTFEKEKEEEEEE